MISIEKVFADISPEPCGYGRFVEPKTFKPVCPTAHLLAYNGEDLPTLFKRKQEGIVKKLAYMIGVLPEALYEFITAWDVLSEKGTEKRLAFDLAITAAEAIEKNIEERQKTNRALWEKIGGNVYPPLAPNTVFPPHVNKYLHSYVLEFDTVSKFVFKEPFLV